MNTRQSSTVVSWYPDSKHKDFETQKEALHRRAFIFFGELSILIILKSGMNYRSLKNYPLEALLWIAAFLLLAIVDLSASSHVSICPMSNMGFDFCPGCGLGRSISLLFRGEFVRSFQMHPLGFFAVLVLSMRIFKLSQSYFRPHGQNS